MAITKFYCFIFFKYKFWPVISEAFPVTHTCCYGPFAYTYLVLHIIVFNVSSFINIVSSSSKEKRCLFPFDVLALKNRVLEKTKNQNIGF